MPHRLHLPLTIALLGLVLVGGVVRMAPDIDFDHDPRASVDTTTGRRINAGALGPGHAAWLWAAVLTLSLTALAGGKRADLLDAGPLIGLSVLGSTLLLWRMGGRSTDIETAWRCGSWVAAIGAGLALHQLARHEPCRRWIVAALIAFILPQFVRSVWFVWVEQPMTVEHFLRHEASILAARGWEHGSPQHLLFKRRMMFPDAVGAFGLSNVFGSILAALTLLPAALAAWHLVPAGRPPVEPSTAAARGLTRRLGRAALPLSLTLPGLATIYLTRSKGAALAFVLGLGVIGIGLWVRRYSTLWQRRAMIAAALLPPVLALAAVLLRGAMGPPPTAEGERSLLFRYHYLHAAARMVADDPLGTLILGIGPDGLRDRYPRFKHPLNPEEVNSTHNLAADWIVMFGLSGMALTAMVVLYLGLAAVRLPLPAPGAGEGRGEGRVTEGSGSRSATHMSDSPLNPAVSRPRSGKREQSRSPSGLHIAPHDALLAAALTVIVFAPQLWIEQGSFTPESFAVWMLGAAGFMVVTLVLATRSTMLDRPTPPAVSLGLFAAAVALITHGQIEMTFFQPGSVAIALALLATAAARGRESGSPALPQGRAVRRLPFMAPLIGLLLGPWTGLVFARPLVRYQHHLSSAADALVGGDLDRAIRDLRSASAWLPREPQPYLWESRLRMEQSASLPARSAASRDRATEALSALNDYASSPRTGPSDRAAETDVLPARLTTSLLRARAQTGRWIASRFGDRAPLALAVTDLREVVARSPHSIPDRLMLADLLWDQGLHEQARGHYQRLLVLSDQAYLDPARQLGDRQARHIRSRLGGE